MIRSVPVTTRDPLEPPVTYPTPSLAHPRLAASCLGMLVFATGCFKPYDDLAPLDLSEVPYDNPLLSVDDAVVQTIDTSLRCPDGEPARVIAIYRTDLEGPQPVAVVLHGGAFDTLVIDEVEEGEAPAEPRTYRSVSRLTRSWSIGKVWETLGTSTTTIEPGQANLGAVPAALTNAGFIQLYPANCWGDLWHGTATTDNGDAVPEAVDGELIRDGGTLAWWTVRFVVEGDFATQEGFSIPEADASQIHLIGLGDGGRGVGELLTIDALPPISSVVLDSTPDQLAPWLAEPAIWPDEVDVVADIYASTDPAVVDAASLIGAMRDGTQPPLVGVAWSSIDPQVPSAAAAPTADAAAALGAPSWDWDFATATHLQLNGDLDRAEQVATWMLEDTLPDFDADPPAER